MPRRFLLAFLLILLPGIVHAQPSLVDGTPESLARALLAEDFAGAMEALAGIEGSDDESTALRLYYRGIIHARAGQIEEALQAFERLEREHPTCRWVTKARFQQAEMHRLLRQFDRAQAIYEEEARRVLSPERQQELAQIYLDFASTLIEPPAETTPEDFTPDYVRAHGLYAQVLELEGAAAAREEALFQMARCLQASRQPVEAAVAFARYLDEYQDAKGARRARVHEALLRRGEVLLVQQEMAAARRSFQELIRSVPPESPQELERQRRAEALRALAQTWPVRGPADLHAASLALGTLRQLRREHPGSLQAFQAGMHEVEIQRTLQHEEPLLAVLRELVAARVQDPEPPAIRALRMQAQSELGRALLEQGHHDEAREAFRAYLMQFPDGPKWAEAQQSLVEVDLAIGAALEQQDRLTEARTAYRKFVDQNPLHASTPSLWLRIGGLFQREAAEIAAAANAAEALPLLESAIQSWQQLTRKYPDHVAAHEAQFRIARMQEEDLQQPVLAIESYRACESGPYAGQARERLRQMLKPQLSVRTERVLRTGEAPVVHLQVRNIAEVKVELYRLDLPTYFRKHQTIRKVEDLDLDLIRPDHSFTVAVDDYRPYLPLEQQLPLPMDGPGVVALVVQADKFRATTLVLRSDIDVVVKSSRREVFVYAQDMLRGAPAEGVEVWAALDTQDAVPVMLQGTTGPDGVVRMQDEALVRAGAVTVFAARAGHCASNGLGLGGLTLATDLQPRGLIYTDRPAYQPGHSVFWRGLIRDVADGHFRFDPGKTYRVEWIDSQGRLFHRSEEVLSRFGTLHGELVLAEAAPAGNYTIRCQDSRGQTFQGSFVVARYQLRPIELLLSPSRRVYYRGEVARVEVEARFYYGEPVADAPLQVTLPDQRRLDLRTDAEGKARFDYDTTESPEQGPLGFEALLPHQQVSARTSAFLALQEFQIELRTHRDVYLVGEPFEVRAHCVAADGEPVARDLKVQLIRRESNPRTGAWREIVVEERSTRSSEGGVARLSFAATHGGAHVVRAVGSDRFGYPVQAERALHVPGEDDPDSLLLLSDTQTLQLGERRELVLFNRAGPGLALLTFEGETVLGYRLLSLQAGRNAVTFEVDERLAPNFALSAAMMQGREFYQTSVEFQVESLLQVRLVPSRESCPPGESVAVDVTVTDSLGRPVVAELSIAVVDEALFGLFADRNPPLSEWLRHPLRTSAALRTTTSCTFEYAGVTTAIADAILQEEERSKAEGKWEEARQGLMADLALPRPSAAADEAPAQSVRLGQRADKAFAGEESDDVLGAGGGAGGRFGRRAGGRSQAETATPRLAETIFWSPTVTTDAAGKAEVEIRFPDRATRWRLTGRGIDPGTLSGQTTATVVTRSEFFIELLTPAFLTEGDQPKLRARVHNGAGRTGKATLRLRAQFGAERLSLPQSIELMPGVEEYLLAPIPAVPLAEFAELSLTIESPDPGLPAVAEALARLPVLPWGVEVQTARSGTLSSQEAFALELPETDIRGRSLELWIGSGLRPMLAELLLDGDPPQRCIWLPPTAADQAADLLAHAELLEGGPLADPARLREQAARRTEELIAAQSPDGGWAIGGAERSDVEVSGFALAALARAAAQGLAVPATSVEGGVTFLQNALRAPSPRSAEEEALLLFALASHRRADFGLANRLHRERGSLPPRAQAWTALALVAMEKLPMARDVATLLAGNLEQDLESRALSLQAFEACYDPSQWPEQVAIRTTVQALLEQRPWFPRRARGLTIAALARYDRATRQEIAGSRIRLRIAGRDLAPLALDADHSSHRIVLGADDLGADARVAVELTRDGAEVQYFALLRGFSRQLPESSDDSLRIRKWRDAPSPRFDGREIPTGFGVLRGTFNPWRNSVQQLPEGDAMRVELRIDAKVTVEAKSVRHGVLEVPLPAGCVLLEDSLGGRANRFDLKDGRLYFHVPLERGGFSVSYALLGAVPGDYRVLPPVLRSVTGGGLQILGEPMDLKVLSRGERSPDAYRATPDELYHLGQQLMDAGQAGAAEDLLARLFDEFGGLLEAGAHAETSRRLLFLALERRDAPRIVRFFEVLREKHPEVTIPFERILATAEAYRSIEEYERSYLLLRAAIEETFGKDLRVVGTLEQQGDFVRSCRTLARLWSEFPDLPVVVETSLTLSDQLLTRAPEAFQHPAWNAEGFTRANMHRDGILLLRQFLALYSNDPRAPEAGLSLVNAFLDLEDFVTAARVAAEMTRRFQEPRFLDAFRYSQAFAEWYRENDDAALGLLQAIVDTTYVTPEGIERASANRDLALYILGQIHHARQDSDKALQHYRRVEGQFPDAAEAVASMTEQTLALDEVTVSRPGQAVQIPVEFKNLTEVELKVYSVDLMTLYLREKNLRNVRSVNLAGIAPVLEETRPLPGSGVFRMARHRVDLGLSEPGAYLVMARGGELHASGLLLISPLELSVREEVGRGAVRIQVMDGPSGQFVRDADVRIIGSLNEDFVLGRTDPRGLFLADGVQGNPTVIARKGEGWYAFYRGPRALGTERNKSQQKLRQETEGNEGPDYLKNIRSMNQDAQYRRSQNLQEEMQRERKGVRIDQVK